MGESLSRRVLSWPRTKRMPNTSYISTGLARSSWTAFGGYALFGNGSRQTSGEASRPRCCSCGCGPAPTSAKPRTQPLPFSPYPSNGPRILDSVLSVSPWVRGLTRYGVHGRGIQRAHAGEGRSKGTPRGVFRTVNWSYRTALSDTFQRRLAHGRHLERQDR